MPLPRDEAEFHAPADFPFETTSPRGFPSGVKKPALMASRARFFRAASADVANSLPGPFAWSTTSNWWLRESKETPSNLMPETVFLEMTARAVGSMRKAGADGDGSDGEGAMTGAVAGSGFPGMGMAGAGRQAESAMNAANGRKIGIRGSME